MKKYYKIIIYSLILAGAISILASNWPDGLEKTAENLGFSQLARDNKITIFQDYELSIFKSNIISRSAAGFLGIFLVFTAAILIIKLFNIKFRKINNKGFTMIELIVVISLIGIISTLAMSATNQSRKKSRDSKRAADIERIGKALQYFYTDHQRFPDTLNDGIDSSGEIIGDDTGPIETALAPYIGKAPADPRYNGDIGADGYFYAYTPACGCGDVLTLNKFETQPGQNAFGRQETTNCGGSWGVDSAHYRYCLIK